MQTHFCKTSKFHRHNCTFALCIQAFFWLLFLNVNVYATCNYKMFYVDSWRFVSKTINIEKTLNWIIPFFIQSSKKTKKYVTVVCVCLYSSVCTHIYEWLRTSAVRKCTPSATTKIRVRQIERARIRIKKSRTENGENYAAG